MDKAVQKLLKAYPCFEESVHDKLRCTITGHEVPKKKEALKLYIDSKKFQRAFGVQQVMKEYGEWFEDLGKGRFGCKVTKKIIADDPEDLRRHVNGPKFIKGLPKFKEQQALAEAKAKEKALRKGMPTSDEEEEEMEEDEEAIDSDEHAEEDEEEIESEYPELDTTADTNKSVDEDNYDFSVMDTEVDNEAAATPKEKKAGGKRKKVAGKKSSFKKKRLA
ncbi:hypothetical protein L596_021095 [Steinernema carpocapsae]|uniref:Surfeit locus protein 2 n=1 Tax=Steinernema carpocapsae TaxID=34508 RepID=A0A4U5MVG4_STECR|nr:hypothetical protein L596_021095 [Steinernema carpocapsae]